MGITSHLNEGKLYRFLKTALRMRRLQKRGSIGKEVLESQNLFDAQLESILQDVDKVDTERVIEKLETL